MENKNDEKEEADEGNLLIRAEFSGDISKVFFGGFLMIFDGSERRFASFKNSGVPKPENFLK